MANHVLNYQWACWLAVWVMVGTFYGLRIINTVVSKTGRGSILVFMLSAVLLIASLISGIYNGIELKHEADDGANVFEFRSLCAAEE